MFKEITRNDSETHKIHKQNIELFMLKHTVCVVFGV